MKKVLILIFHIIAVFTCIYTYKIILINSTSEKAYYEINTFNDPIQSLTVDDTFSIKGKEKTYYVKKKFNYEIHAKVISKKNYNTDLSSDISPTDLALIWGDLVLKANMDNIDYSQSGRWYFYRYDDINKLTISQSYIKKHSANTHIIPATVDIGIGIKNIKNGDNIILKGYLVDVSSDQFTWNSSETRNDTGNGACEIMYVTYLYHKEKEFN